MTLGGYGQFDAKTFLREIVGSSSGGQSVSEMRERVKVLDEIEAADSDMTWKVPAIRHRSVPSTGQLILS